MLAKELRIISHARQRPLVRRARPAAISRCKAPRTNAKTTPSCPAPPDLRWSLRRPPHPTDCAKCAPLANTKRAAVPLHPVAKATRSRAVQRVMSCRRNHPAARTACALAVLPVNFSRAMLAQPRAHNTQLSTVRTATTWAHSPVPRLTVCVSSARTGSSSQSTAVPTLAKGTQRRSARQAKV